MEMKSEIENEVRNPKDENPKELARRSRATPTHFGFRYSDFFRPSDFEHVTLQSMNSINSSTP